MKHLKQELSMKSPSLIPRILFVYRFTFSLVNVYVDLVVFTRVAGTS